MVADWCPCNPMKEWRAAKPIPLLGSHLLSLPCCPTGPRCRRSPPAWDSAGWFCLKPQRNLFVYARQVEYNLITKALLKVTVIKVSLSQSRMDYHDIQWRDSWFGKTGLYFLKDKKKNTSRLTLKSTQLEWKKLHRHLVFRMSNIFHWRFPRISAVTEWRPCWKYFCWLCWTLRDHIRVPQR